MSNPVLANSAWDGSMVQDRGQAQVMSVQGAVTKTAILLGIMLGIMLGVMIVGYSGLSFDAEGVSGRFIGLPIMTAIIGGAIGGLIMVLLTMFVRSMAWLFGPLYAVCEGFFLGGITAMVHGMYPGLPFLAAAFTVGVLAALLFLYSVGIIRASDRFVRGVVIATGGLFLGVAILWILSMFGVGSSITASLYGSGPIGIGFSAICIILAAFNLIVDFRIIEDGAKHGQPKRMEWVAATGLLVTLVWLYIEILYLLMKLRSND